MCLSDAAIDRMKHGEEKVAAIAEAKVNAKNVQFSSFLCMLALSSVLHLPIESYIPIAAESGTSSLSCMFTCTILPRQIRKWCLEKLHMFHCESIPFDYLQSPSFLPRKITMLLSVNLMLIPLIKGSLSHFLLMLQGYI